MPTPNPEPASAPVPEAIGDFGVLAVLGGGRASIVYHVEHPAHESPLALKIARTVADSAGIEREYSLLARLSRSAHPGVVAPKASGFWAARAWYAMEYLPGGDIAGPAAQDRAKDLRQRLGLALALADAVAVVHEHGIVHGDLSPQNVRLREPSEPVIVDFGVAADFGAPSAGVLQRLGTPGYVAPERLAGTAHDFRADVYSLGCILYELLAARPVFTSDRSEGLARQHLETAPIAPSRWSAELSPAIDALVLGMLEKDPRRRIAHARDVCGEIAQILEVAGGPWQERAAPLLPARFAGREEDLRRLRERVGALLAGRGGVMLVSGESGIGKTRLVHELLSSLPESAVTVLAAGAGTPDDRAGRALTGFRPVLAERSAAAELDRLRSKDAVYVAVLRDLVELCRRRPLLLVIDDLESMDELTLGFLRSTAARELPALPCLIVCTSTDEAVIDADTLRLAPLSGSAIEDMLCDLFAARSVSAELLESIRSSTGMSPLLVLEFARHLRQERLVARAGGRLTIAAGAPDFHPFSSTAMALDPPLKELSAAAAIIGNDVDPELLGSALRALGDRGASSLERGLSELCARGILTARPGGAYRFTHQAYRSACEPCIEESRRAIIHEKLALKLAERPPAARPHREIGLHWARAGKPARALGPLRIAARRAAAALELEDAVWLLDTAYRLCARIPAPERKHARLAVRIGLELLESLARVARHDDVFAVGRELLERIPPARRLLRARVHWFLAQAHRITGDYGSAEAELDVADRALGPAHTLRSRVERRSFVDLALLRVFVLYARRDLARLELELTTLAPIVARYGHPAQRASYSMWRANAIAVRERYRHSPAAIRFERRALELFRRTRGYERDATMSHFDLAFMLLLGRGKHCREALALLEDAALRCEHLGDAILNARISTYRAVAHRRLRQVAQCRALAERALVASSACKLRGYMGAAKGCLAWTALCDDARSEARRLAEEARGLWSGPGEKRGEEYPFQWLAFLPLLALAASEEALDEAGALVLELIAPTQQKLAAQLDDALSGLAAEWEALSDAARGQRLQAVIRLAAAHRYL